MVRTVNIVYGARVWCMARVLCMEHGWGAFGGDFGSQRFFFGHW